MLPSSLAIISVSVSGMPSLAKQARKSKAQAPKSDKKGVEMKCSSPFGPLPILATAKTGTVRT